MAFSIFSIFSGKGNKGHKQSQADTARITNILQQLVTDHTLLTVKLPGSDHSFISALLEIEPITRTLKFDELSPPDGHKLFLEKKAMLVKCQTRGADLAFHTDLIQTGKIRGIHWYDTTLPAQLDYVQRRKHFRARVRESQRISVTAQHGESGTSISGYISDISSLGICVMFNTSQKIERGDTLKRCRLRLPDGKHPCVDIDIRHSRSLPNERLLVGGRFSKPDANTRRMIDKLVRKLERNALRNT